MIDEIALSAFDELSNPILFCETDGTLLYKNQAAARHLGKLQTKAKLFKHLDEATCARFAAEPIQEAFPAFASVSYMGEEYRALCDLIYFERRPVVLFFFSQLLVYDLAFPLFCRTTEELRSLISAERLVNQIRNAYTADHPYPAGYDPETRLGMTRVFLSLIEYVARETAYGLDRVLYRLDRSLEILAYAARSVLGKIGIDLVFYADVLMTSTRLVDFKPFALLVSHLLILAVEFSDGPLLRVHIHCDKEDEALITISADQSFVLEGVDYAGVNKLISFLPGRSLDLYLFDKLCHTGKYRFDFSIRECEKNNLCLRFTSPTYRATRLRERDEIDRDSLLQLIDRFGRYRYSD